MTDDMGREIIHFSLSIISHQNAMGSMFSCAIGIGPQSVAQKSP
jgi:hypothetical protein